MSRRLRRQAPALAVAAVALVAALGGTVYAAKRINGHTIRAKSLPGNRLVPRSLPWNRLKPGSIPGSRLAPGSIPGSSLAPGSVTGIEIDASTVGQVPQAVHAETADSARDAETALQAVSAIDAQRINGYEAGCRGKTRPFAGACWQTEANATALSAPDAAAACARQGGELPDALSLAAFSKEPGIHLSPGNEWSGDIPSYTGPDAYSVVTISPDGTVKAAVSTETREFRCVIPLVG